MSKRDRRPLTGVSTIFDKSHLVTRLANERASFLNMNDINDIAFMERLTASIVVL
jgi:hypothetical protein